MERIRITYAKTQALRYTSNLDVHKIWERTIRRAHLPLAYSQGFNPQPRLNQAAPLPLGMTSQVEMVDFWLEEDLSIEDIKSKLENAPQPGIEISTIESIDLKEPALPTQVLYAEYSAACLDPVEVIELKEKITSLLSSQSLPRQWRGKNYDLRPLIEHLEVMSLSDGTTQIWMRLSARERAVARAEEVLSALDIDPVLTRIERIGLILK